MQATELVCRQPPLLLLEVRGVAQDCIDGFARCSGGRLARSGSVVKSAEYQLNNMRGSVPALRPRVESEQAGV